ncbi:MAG: TIGR03960 family B12-binding radical SAM protein [Candidatus Margulisiibacteriota bacterium]
MHDIIEKILPSVSKPGRYIGNELNSVHKPHKDKLKFALAYPDTYEIGMSNLGLQILYHILNQRPDIVAERFYAPWPDMEEKMKENNIPLFSLESWTPIKTFDIVGFSIQNELTYTNVLNMLQVAGLPLMRKDRNNSHPLIIAGGACTNNPEPLSDFIDAFVIGDGEEVILEIVDTYKQWKSENIVDADCNRHLRNHLLTALSKIPGIYVPDFNEFKDIKRRIVKDLNSIDYPASPIVPFIEIVHDRATIEIMRGCPHRCKFCQAGTVNKPVRMLSPEKVIGLAKETIKNTGFEEVSLVSLSSSDYPYLYDVAIELGKVFSPKRISLSLPSLRADNLKEEVAKEMLSVRQSGFTIAPEAGTQRLRDHICKDLTEEKIIDSVKTAIKSGSNRIKLYFMIGLPTETDEDIKGIVDLAYLLIKEAKAITSRAKIIVNVSTFIPKKNTPFENEKMIGLDEIKRKQDYLKNNLRHKSIELKWHDSGMSTIEGLLSMGGKEAGKVLLKAFESGCRFDNWAEYFDYSKWEKAIAENTA